MSDRRDRARVDPSRAMRTVRRPGRSGGRAAAAESARGSLTRAERLRPTLRGVGTLIVGVVAVLLAYSSGRQEILVAGVAALLLAGSGLVFTRIRRPRLEVVRLFSPPVVAAGSTVQVTLRIRNLANGSSPHLIWNDAIPWHESAAPHELLPIGGTGTTPQRRVVSASYELHPPRRGLYEIGPLVIEHEDPFGMARSTLALGEADRLVVVPAIMDLPQGGPNLADGEGSAQLVQRRVTGNDDDLSTREYRTGDALRRVHWRASARRGELMVRQEEHRSRPDARILIDTRLDGYPDVEIDDADARHPIVSSDAFEWAVRMLASLGIHLDGSGFSVGVEETADPQVDQLGERWDGSRREGFLTSLAGVRLVDAAVGRIDRSGVIDTPGPLFAVLGDPDDVTLDWLIRHRRGGDVAIAFLVEPREESVRRLGDAGWLTIPVHPWDDPASAWMAASSEAGYIRGGH